MSNPLDKLPAFALPFVTRSLRGTRARRFLTLSAVLAGLALVLGVWLAFGSGEFERDVRVEAGHEQSIDQREFETFTIFAEDGAHRRALESETAGIADGLSIHALGNEFDAPGEAEWVALWGREWLRAALLAPTDDPEHRALQDEARALLGSGAYDWATYYDNRDYVVSEYDRGRLFAWDDPPTVEALTQIIARDGVPEVATYASPLGVRHALGFAAAIAGLVLLALGTVVGPLLVAVQQAQERHENTMLPLSGTSLSPRELVLGLASGPLAIVAIFAVPQAALFLLGAAALGELAAALGLLAILLASMTFLVFGAQLLGDLIGKRRTPGVLGIALTALAVGVWAVAASLTGELYGDGAGLTALLPHLGLASAYAATFGPSTLPSFTITGAAANAVGGVILGMLTLQALSRKLADHDGALLDAREGFLGALTCVALANLATAQFYDPIAQLYVGLLVIALPLAVLLMCRVPVGQGPAKLRKIRLPHLVAEFAGWFALHGVVWYGVGGDSRVLHPVALAWLAWAIVVLALMSTRLVAVPAKIAANVWLACCGLALLMGFAHAVFWGAEGGGIDEVFIAFAFSPVLGMLQVALTIWVPISLVRRMRSDLAGVR